jgi:hypothetical protein
MLTVFVTQQRLLSKIFKNVCTDIESTGKRGGWGIGRGGRGGGGGGGGGGRGEGEDETPN